MKNLVLEGNKLMIGITLSFTYKVSAVGSYQN